jgi:Flp pilus assembly protein TadD
MTKPNRLGTALTAVSLVAIVSACAGPGASRPRSASMFGGEVKSGKLGLATRAQLALASNDIATAVPLAEEAVEGSPQDAGFRALLGNCYLAAGRFASAEAAFRDSLAIYSNQPQVILKLALVQIGQGKNDDARRLLAEAQGLIDPSDAGLALALAGDPQSAIGLLEPAARAVGADSRSRQNLALAYAFAGDWTQARNVAAQDVPADQLDARIQQWMVLANPARASDQVAALIGIQPVAGDPGQPVRLALNKGEAVRQAAAEPAPAPLPPAEPTAVAAVDVAPVAEPTPFAEPTPVVEPVVVAVAPPAPQPVEIVEASASPIREARPALSPAAVRLSDSAPLIRKAAAPKPRAGNSRAVVQLGAYSSRDRVAVAWARAAGKYGSLKGFTPVTAKFEGPRGTVYRLSVKGFANNSEAINLCASLKRAGKNCFVRSVSGDAPVQFASR